MNVVNVKNAVLNVMTENKDDEHYLHDGLYEITCAIADMYWAKLIDEEEAERYACVMIETSKNDCGWGHFSSIISPHKIDKLLQ